MEGDRSGEREREREREKERKKEEGEMKRIQIVRINCKMKNSLHIDISNKSILNILTR